MGRGRGRARSPPSPATSSSRSASTPPSETTSDRSCRGRDRAVAIVEGGVALGPGLRALAHLEGGLVGEADRSSRARGTRSGRSRSRSSGERHRRARGSQSSRARSTRSPTTARHSTSEAGREARLHHRQLVGERQVDHVVALGGDGRVRLSRDQRCACCAGTAVEGLHHLGRRARTGVTATTWSYRRDGGSSDAYAQSVSPSPAQLAQPRPCSAQRTPTSRIQ